MIKSLKGKVFKKNHSKNKTVILLSDDKIYSLRINFFFQFFLLISGIIVSSFITYHLTIYMKSQNSIQEKDHKIFVGAEINKNLSKCSDCELSTNLWLCLTCGNVGCGRKYHDGTGGNNHGIDHF